MPRRQPVPNDFPRQQPGESDIDYRRRLAQTIGAEHFGPEFQAQLLEDEAFLEAVAERRRRLRRTQGPTGAGTTVFTSPLGVFAPLGGAPLMLGSGGR